jgi:hypothetical protein
VGYTTDFTGQITVTPALNDSEIAFLRRFAGTRRMNRRNGPYYTGTGWAGQDHEPDIVEYNRPPEGQPELWCHWVPTDDGSRIEWSGSEKFYSSPEWMAYLIDTFLRPGAGLEAELRDRVTGRFYPEEFARFTFDHTLNGVIEAQGEFPEDRWILAVDNNEIAVEMR